MKRFTSRHLITVMLLSGAHLLASAQQAPVPAVSGNPVPELEDQIKFQIAKGAIIGYISWTNSQEQESHPSSTLQIASQREVPSGWWNPKEIWVNVGKITVKNLTKKNGRYTRHFTVTGLPASVPVTITARTADGQYSAQQEVRLAPDKGRTLSLKLE